MVRPAGLEPAGRTHQGQSGDRYRIPGDPYAAGQVPTITFGSLGGVPDFLNI